MSEPRIEENDEPLGSPGRSLAQETPAAVEADRDEAARAPGGDLRGDLPEEAPDAGEPSTGTRGDDGASMAG